MATTTRRRVIPHSGLPNKGTVRTLSHRPGEMTRVSVTSADNHNLFSHLNGSQVTVSENHPAWRSAIRGTFKGDVGGEFFTTRQYCEASGPGGASIGGRNTADWLGNYDEAFYSGPLLCTGPDSIQFPTALQPSSRETLQELGATAISRCSPSNPAADLTTMLGEFVKEGLPSKIGSTLKGWRGMSRKDRRKAIGSEYLNYQFGWKPIANELKDLSLAIVERDAIWRQYQRDAGKLVRRRYVFPTEETTEVKDLGTIGPWMNPSSSLLWNLNAPHDGRVFRSDKMTRRRWFSGAFTYYLPDDIGVVAENVIQAKKLLGLSLTPDTVWSLTPWSWALDWFSNTGDVLENWSNWAIDGQVLRYGYFMEHVLCERTYTYSGSSRLRGGGTPASIRLVVETKQRIKAGPYGFGLSFDGLSTTQKAIVAALGMTKSR